MAGIRADIDALGLDAPVSASAGGPQAVKKRKLSPKKQASWIEIEEVFELEMESLAQPAYVGGAPEVRLHCEEGRAEEGGDPIHSSLLPRGISAASLKPPSS